MCARCRGASGRSNALPASVPTNYAETRRALHAVAEYVLAAALHDATGRIGLRATPGGFGTPSFPVAGTERQVRIDGTDIVVSHDASERRAPLQTLRQAAAIVGVEPGAPESVYIPTTPLDPDAPLAVDRSAAGAIHDWFQRSAEALERFRRAHGPLRPTIAQLWPEHFDLAITMGDVNYGGSPGDDEHESGYAYVGPWNLDGLGDEFWNEPFGASRKHTELGSGDDLVACFEIGYDLTS
jgi:hypothetical protein